MIAKALIVRTIKNDSAFSTGVELNRIREYKSIDKVWSEPIRKIVVFIFEKLNIKATTKAPVTLDEEKENGVRACHFHGKNSHEKVK